MYSDRQEMEEWITSQIGEGIHTCLRKFCDSDEAGHAYRAISRMPDEEWHGAASMVASVVMDRYHKMMQEIASQRRVIEYHSTRDDILTAAMAEVKATNDGGSDQSITDIVEGCIRELHTTRAAHLRLKEEPSCHCCGGTPSSGHSRYCSVSGYPIPPLPGDST